MTRNQRLVLISLLAAQAVIIGLLERYIPSPFSFAPGVKLGLANIITCIALYTLSVKDTVMIIIVRLILTTFLSGTLSTFLYSSSGAILSFIGMFFIMQLGPSRVSLIGVSTVGGVLHNFGQLIMASIITNEWTVLLLLPYLTGAGILSGIAIGIAANYLLPHVHSLRFYKAPKKEVSR
ncbi:MAG: Gx transporter family protein [Turicibacter sp.]|nr:Gx transporter family protein [Turicibacter sp.]